MAYHAAIFGVIVADMIAEPMDLRHPPRPGALVALNSLQLTTGGNVCNTGIAMAKFGMNAIATGIIGKDTIGTAILERMRDAGLDVSSVVTTDKKQTSATVVAVEPGGERCFFHTAGANELLNADLFRSFFPVFAKCQWLEIGYFGLLPNLTADLPNLLADLKHFAPDLHIALDTIHPTPSVDLLWPILPHVDCFAPSRTEAELLTGQTDPAQMIALFRKRMPTGLIAIKLDVDGCLLDDTRKQLHIPAAKINVIDSTGAGDTWFAALLTAMIKKMPLQDAGRFANRAAADCCLAFGASTGVRSFDDTVARM